MSIINHTSHVYFHKVESSIQQRILCMALLIGLPFSLFGATHVVTSAEESPAPGPGTLRHSIENATSGDTILIDPSITEIIMDHFVGITIESKNLTIIGHEDFTIRCTQSFYVFRILSSTVKIIDVVMKNAQNFGAILGLNSNIEIYNCEFIDNHSDQYGGAIYINGGNLKINNSIITGNSGRSGGGILFQGDQLNISNSEITNNEISNGYGNGGGIFLSRGSLILNNSEVTNNQATGTGGGIYSNSDCTISNSIVNNNTASSSGGGIYMYSGKLKLINQSQVNGNTSSVDGGGIYLNSSADTEFEATNSTISHNETIQYSGGGIHIRHNGHTKKITNCELIGNKAQTEGGAIYNQGTLELSNVNVQQNRARHGGGLYIYSGTATINNSHIDLNDAITDGGGIYCRTNLTITNYSTVHHNEAGQTGGGLWVKNIGGLTSTISSSSIEENKALRAAGILIDEGTLNIESESTVHKNENTGNYDGGGIYNTNALLHIDNSAVTQNSSPVNGGGIFIANNSNASLTTDQAFIAENSARNGGGVYVSTTADIHNSIINQNTATGPGGGIYMAELTGARLEITESQINKNTASHGGGIMLYRNNSSNTITNCVFINNSAMHQGGGLWMKANTTIAESTFENNQSNNQGGGVFMDQGTSGINGTTIALNSANTGGGLYVHSGNLEIKSTSIVENESTADGGGLYHNSGLVLIKDLSELSENSSSRHGGGIYSRAPLEMDNSSINNNSSQEDGGGIYALHKVSIKNNSHVNSNKSGQWGGGLWLTNPGQNSTIANSEIKSNEAAQGGGIHFKEGNLLIEQGSVIQANVNTGFFDGAGIYNENGNLTIRNSAIKNNKSPRNGGGIFVADNVNASLSLEHATISHNEAGLSGGGVYTHKNLRLDQTTFANNRAGGNDGGGLFAENGDVEILNNSVFRSNQASHHGGGIYLHQGTHKILNSTIAENESGNSGGGIFFTEHSLTIENSKINNNSSHGNKGGGIHNEKGALTIHSSEINDNSAYTWGGGIYSSYLAGAISFSISDSEINGNTANNGGGISVDVINQYTIDECEFIGNKANNQGGGINIIGGAGMVEINNCTLKNNTASSGGGIFNSSNQTTSCEKVILEGNSAGVGGGIANKGHLQIEYSTITNNNADQGGGVQNTGNNGVLAIQNSIVALNSSGNGPDIFNSSSISGDYNLLTDYEQSGLSSNGTNNLTGDPLFASPFSNLNLTDCSPAIQTAINGDDMGAIQSGLSSIIPDILTTSITVTLDENNPDSVSITPSMIDYDFGSCTDITLELNPVFFNCSDVGQSNSTLITITYSGGQSFQESIDLIVIDNLAPQFTVLPEEDTIFVQASEPVPAHFPVQYKDQCGGMVNLNITDYTSTISCGNQITRTYTITDPSGNNISYIQTIIIGDENGPQITILDQEMYDISQLNLLPDYYVSHDTSYKSFTTDQILRAYCGSTQLVQRTYTAIDACQNVTIATHNINYTDSADPGIVKTVPWLQGVENGDTVHLVDCIYPEASQSDITWTDNSGEAKVYTHIYSANLPQVPPFGQYKLLNYQYRVEDGCGNDTELDFHLGLYDLAGPQFQYFPKDTMISSVDSLPEADPDVVILDVCTYVVWDTVTTNPVIDPVSGDTTAFSRKWIARDLAGHETFREQLIHIRNQKSRYGRISGRVTYYTDTIPERFDGEIGENGISFSLYRIDRDSISLHHIDSVTSQNWFGAMGSFYFTSLPIGKYRIEAHLPEDYKIQPDSLFDIAGWSDTLEVWGDTSINLGLLVMHPFTMGVDSTSEPVADSLPVNNLHTFVDSHTQVELDWKIYPNPSPGFINFQLPEGKTFHYDVLNQSGKKVKSGPIYHHSSIGLESLQDGMYFIRIRSDHHILGYKKLLILP